VIFTWLIHEFAHWLTSELLGYKSIMQINGTFYAEGENPKDWHKIVVSAFGPFVTFLQGLIVFLYLKSRSWNKYLYPILFIAFYMVYKVSNKYNLNWKFQLSTTLSVMITSSILIISDQFLGIRVL